MRIQHNIMAMNSYRNYNTNTSALSKNLEKLSSGYRINRAGDDAAGLAISEKMRAQISGLEQASNNVKDGISLVQTAEGALQEVQDMLNRMVTLSEESANGTYQDEVDRENLSSEMDALKEEINRIADSANFNGIQLLDGSQSAQITTATDGTAAVSKITTVAEVKGSYTFNAGGMTATKALVIEGQTIAFTTSLATTMNNLNGQTIGNFTVAATSGGTITLTQKTGSSTAAAPTITLDGSGTATQSTAGVTAVAGRASTTGTKAQSVVDFTGISGKDAIGGSVTIDGVSYKFVATGKAGTDDATTVYVELNDTDTSSAIATTLQGKITGLTGFTAATNGAKVEITEDAAGGSKALSVASKGVGNGGLTLQIGDTSDSWNQMTVSISDMHTSTLGIDDISIGDQTSAAAAISVIKNAINQVSSTRGDLGAIQNRLEHTSNNLSVMTENIQDAESTIRDTDIADEMTAYTKNQILVQSAQAMLAQANSVPQGVLQLLQ